MPCGACFRARRASRIRLTCSAVGDGATRMPQSCPCCSTIRSVDAVIVLFVPAVSATADEVAERDRARGG